MKIICDCGNEDVFNTKGDTGEENRIEEGSGQYATIDKFSFWGMHYEIGIVCDKCGKKIWIFK